MTKVLVADDEPSVREILSRFLTSKGDEVITAADGEQALEMFRLHKPELVLLDIMMPRLNGLETLKRIRSLDDKVGVIMISALGDEATARQAIALGAYDYITKPFSFDYLETTVMTKLLLR